MADTLAGLEAELEGLRKVAEGLGDSLYVAELGVAANFNGAADLRARVLGLLSQGRAENPAQGQLSFGPSRRYVQVAAHRRRYPGTESGGPGCGCRESNPPRFSLGRLGGVAMNIAKSALSAAIRRAQATPTKLAVGVLGTLAVWDLLVPDEAVEVQRIISDTEVVREQYNRMAPEDALRIHAEVAKANGEGGGLFGGLFSDIGSVVQWTAVALGVWFIGVPLAKRVMAKDDDA